MDFGADELA
jgi:hypothetical protein